MRNIIEGWLSNSPYSSALCLDACVPCVDVDMAVGWGSGMAVTLAGSAWLWMIAASLFTIQCVTVCVTVYM